MTSNDHDKEIIELYLQRSEHAIVATRDRYGGYCRAIAMNITGDAGDAEEVENDAYLNVWNSIPPNKPDNFIAYIGRITRNLAINRYRANNTQKRAASVCALSFEELSGCLPSVGSTDEVGEYNELVRNINEFLSGQNKLNRVVFVRRYFYCDECKKIASALQVSENKIRAVLFRMRKRLKKYLEERYE